MNNNASNKTAQGIDPIARAESRVASMEKAIKSNREHLRRAKVEVLNQKLMEIDRLCCDVDCPPVAIILTGAGSFRFIQVEGSSCLVDPERMSIQDMKPEHQA